MPETTSAITELNEARINDPRVLYEQVLKEGNFSGKITLPMYYDLDGVKLDAPQTKTIPFLMEDGFGFSLGNKWNSFVPQEVSEFISSLVNLASFGDMLNTPQIQLISKAMSTAVWNGSEIPRFRVSLVFIATRRSYNPVNIIKALASTCLPLPLDDFNDSSVQKLKEGTANMVEKAPEAIGLQDTFIGDLSSKAAGVIKSIGLVAPLHYNPKINYTDDSVSGTENCTVSLNIGKWFSATQLIVENIDGIEFSKEIIAPQPAWINSKEGKRSANGIYQGTMTETAFQSNYGFPLYAKCTLTLRPLKIITYDEFCKFFKQPQVQSSNIANNAIRI